MSAESGCAQCWPEDAAAAWQARQRLVLNKTLVDESHFLVNLLACTHCKQVFMSIFTEMIDWDGGNDPQDWLVVPLAADESRLLAEGMPLLEFNVTARAATRRTLRRSFPRAGDIEVGWGHGAFVLPHD
jgi:hypothetical protein